MNTLTIWLTLAGLGLVTLFTRNFFIVLGDRLRLPERVSQALRYAPACALAALIVPEIFMQEGHLITTALDPRLMGAFAALATMLASRNVLATMAAGTAVFWLLG